MKRRALGVGAGVVVALGVVGVAALEQEASAVSGAVAASGSEVGSVSGVSGVAGVSGVDGVSAVDGTDGQRPSALSDPLLAATAAGFLALGASAVLVATRRRDSYTQASAGVGTIDLVGDRASSDC